MAVKIDMYGSRVLRDVFRHMGSGKYEINRCISNIPITTLYEEPISFNNTDFEKFPLNNYEKKMLKLQFRKNVVGLLKKSEADVLLLDFADEYMERLILSGGEGWEQQVAMMEGKETTYEKWFRQKGFMITDIVSPIEQEMDVVEDKIKQFARSLIQSKENPTGYQEKNIIVLETLYSADILGNDGNLHRHEEKYRLHEYNEWLRKIYMIFYKYCQDCKVIKLPDFVHSTENHIRGVHPLHYMENTYEYFAKAVDVLNGYSQINTVDNLYKEQSLMNKLQTRVVNSSMMYGLKGQINSLNKEVTELKKLLQEKETNN